MKALLCGLVFFLALSLVTERASAGHPDPDCSDTPLVITISPDGSIPYTVVVRQMITSCVARASSLVEIEFSPEADALIAWAPGQAHPLIYVTADPNGEATFYIAGSGCIDAARFTGPTFIVQVRADGIVLAEPSVVNSPDVVDDQGMLPTDTGTGICENGISVVGLSDAVFHTAPIKGGLVEPCTRLTGDPSEPVALEDAILITPYIKNGIVGSCQ